MPHQTKRTLRTFEIVLAAVVMGVMIAACGSSTSPSTVSSIAVTGNSPAVGTTSQLTATATLSSNSTQDVTSTSTWTSSNPAIATVSASGLVTAVGSGIVVIQATYNSVTGAETLSIP